MCELMKNKTILFFLILGIILLVSSTLLVVEVHNIISRQIQQKKANQTQIQKPKQWQKKTQPPATLPTEEENYSSRPAGILEPISPIDLQIENIGIEKKPSTGTAPKHTYISINAQDKLFISISSIFQESFSKQDSNRLAATMLATKGRVGSGLFVVYKLANKLAEKMPNPPSPEKINHLLSLAEKQILQMKAETPRPQLKEHPLPTTDISTWQPIDCWRMNLPQDVERTDLTCYRRADDICAAQPNGRPYVCMRKNNNGYTIYQEDAEQKYLRIHSYDLTHNRQSVRRYYQGNLIFEENRDVPKNSSDKTFFEKDQIIRIQADSSNKVLSTYYLSPKGTYRHEGPNPAMPSKMGSWIKMNNDVFINDTRVFTLPSETKAPDLCQMFENFCTLRPLKS